MWCMAELDPAYIARMEDVLAVYERPTIPRSPWSASMRNPFPFTRTCAHPAPRGRGASPAATVSTGAVARRICSRSSSRRATLHLCHRRSVRWAVSPSRATDRCGLSGGPHDPRGMGQPQHPLREVPGRRVRCGGGSRALEPPHRPSHSEAGQLVESGRHRTQLGQSRLPRHPSSLQSLSPPTRSAVVDHPRNAAADPHQLALLSARRAAQVWLSKELIYLVTDLGRPI